jgi:histidyl-tRNA synthetase
MEAQKTEFPEPKKCDLYIASMGENANVKAAEIATSLRSEGMCVQFDTVGRGLKPQMKYANKIGALYTLVLGDSELETGNIKLKNMETGNETEMTLSDFAENFQSVVIKDAMSGFESLGMEGIDLASFMGGTL